MLGRDVEVRPSPRCGLGVYALTELRRGFSLGYYGGEVLTAKRYEQLYENTPCDSLADAELVTARRARGLSRDYTFDLGNGYRVDAADEASSNWTRYLNHSAKRPNVEPHVVDGDSGARARVRFDVVDDVVAGEELVFDYGEAYFRTRPDTVVVEPTTGPAPSGRFFGVVFQAKSSKGGGRRSGSGKGNKQDLPSKLCVVCGRPFTWRKKWERCWDEVTCCSTKCNAERRRGPSSVVGLAHGY